MPRTTFSPARALLLLIVALLGFAHIAFLPPFEGFDETAHLSSIQQIADTGTIPKLGRDKLSTDVENYAGPYGTQSSVSYRAFFDGGAKLPAREARLYEAGGTLNWEAQHPPLYYVLLTPLYKMVRAADWNTLLLTLRGVSWVIAFAGFAIGGLATMRILDRTDAPPSAVVVVLGWPLLFPQFFPEMARLGNDSLCLLFMGLSWALLLLTMTRRDHVSPVMLGTTLGAGLWTKAFFIPIAAGIGAYLIYAAWREQDKRLLRGAIVAMVTAAVIGGAWYVAGLLATGSTAFLQADKPTDFWETIGQTFDPLVFIRGILSMAASVVWSGTWSFVKLGPLAAIPVLVLMLLMAFAALRGWKNQSTLFRAALFVVSPFIAGLIAHLVTQMVRDNYGNGTPGWYLHILAGPLALILARGWQHKWPFFALAAYALVFHAACWAMQLSYFSGCALKTEGYNRVGVSDCLIVPDNLAVLGWPMFGSIALLLALISGFVYAVKQRDEISP